MLDIKVLIDDWQSTDRTRLVMDADRVARDPRLALVGAGGGGRGGRRLFARGPGAPASPEERFADKLRRSLGSAEVSAATREEAAFARVHLADLLLVGKALEHGSGQQKRIRSISHGTRAQLLGEIIEAIVDRTDELVHAGTSEGRTRKGMEWEMKHIRRFLSPDVLEHIASSLLKRKWDDGTRMFHEGLGTVGVMVPSLGGASRSVLSLAASFMTGNFTMLAAPTPHPVTTMLIAQMADGVLREHGVEALSALVPDGTPELMGILAESPRVDGLVLFEEGGAQLDAAAQAMTMGKVVVGAWETTDVAIVWDGVDVDSAAEEIIRARFTDSGRLPSSIGRVLVHRDAREPLIKALEAQLHSLRVGLPSDPTTDIGPLASLADLEAVTEVVREAKELGAKVVHGGERINWRSEADPVGMYFQPTLMEDCDAGMRIMNERLVGPVLPICTMSNEAEAKAQTCKPRRPGRVWIWATSRADRDRLVDGLRAPGILFFGHRPEGELGAMSLSDAWGALELAERLSYKSWRGPVDRQ